MYQTVQQSVEASTSWNGLTAFESAYTAFSAKMLLLEELAQQQVLALKGVKPVKTAKREKLAKKAAEVVAALKAFASATDNPGLIGMLNFRISKFQHGAAQLSLQLIGMVIEQATIHLNDLGAFGVDQAKINEVITLRDEFVAVLNSPRTAIVDRKVITLKIDELVNEIDAILKDQMDNLVVLLDQTDHAFFLNYNAARVIVDHKAHHSSAIDPGGGDPGQTEGSDDPPSGDPQEESDDSGDEE